MFALAAWRRPPERSADFQKSPSFSGAHRHEDGAVPVLKVANCLINQPPTNGTAWRRNALVLAVPEPCGGNECDRAQLAAIADLGACARFSG